MITELERIPGLRVLQEREPPQPGYRFFVLSYTQPADHLAPSRGTFEQVVTLMHRSTSAPTVAYTTGYGLSTDPYLFEPSILVEGNQVGIEERFFGTSIPDDPDYALLNIYQAAADHHRLIDALRSIYSRSWLSTGGSKGGMATVYHRRFFPDDVDGSVVYSAPNDVDNEDDAYDEFLANVGTASCREALIAVTRAALERRDEIVPVLGVVGTEVGYTFEYVGGVEGAFESAASSIYWSFWQSSLEEDCATIPAPDAPIAELAGFVSRTTGLLGNNDFDFFYYYPYSYQAATQLGFPDTSGWATAIEDLLLYDEEEAAEEAGEEAREAAENAAEGSEGSGTLIEFDSSAMADIDHWVKHEGRALLFMYGENDPWSAEPFEPGPGTLDSVWYMVPGGNHRAFIELLPDAERLEATNHVRRWAGLAPLAELPVAPEAVSLAAGAGTTNAELLPPRLLPRPRRF